MLQAAVRLADTAGIESLSMRRLGQELGVEAMALYNHVDNKEDLLDGMVDVVVGKIAPAADAADWKAALRGRALSGREVLKHHPWAPAVFESRKNATPTMMAYMDTIIAIFREGGFSLDLTHHAFHALGSRMLGFTQELFDDSEGQDTSPEAMALLIQQLSQSYPNMAAMVQEISHDEDSIVGQGCDDQFEFEFALDLLLDGLERLRDGG